jgi:hypothetical protein
MCGAFSQCNYGSISLISTSIGALDMRVVKDKSQTYEVSADVATSLDR